MLRRSLIQFTAGGLIFGPAFKAYSQAPATVDKKVVWLVLRGAMDSLHTVIPVGDPQLEQYRHDFLSSIQDKLLPLDADFALHPSLTGMHRMYLEGDLLPVVATATPYRSRSHFEAQDILESGTLTVQRNSGWLARAMSHKDYSGVAISKRLPISLRGSTQSSSWFPSELANAPDDLYEMLAQLYEQDPQLQTLLKKISSTNNLVGGTSNNRGRFEALAQTAGKFLTTPNGPDCVMMELGGWDTHNRQQNRMEKKLAQLDRGLQTLQQSLGRQWQNTLVIIATEFGRTVAINGTGGTDHGTASALFLAGGAIRGGKVAGDWPGLSDTALYEGRDLQPTSNIQDWIEDALSKHGWNLMSAS